jgi:membrane-associated protease RseP (regulator of RpoE activity)
MVRRATDRNYALIATLIGAAAVGTWLTLSAYQRSFRPGAASAAPAGAAASLAPRASPPAATALTQPAAAQPASVQPQPGAAVAVSATGELTDTTQQDQRQLAKIARGMSANPGGGIRVDATPPGSVTGQLQLHAGDVIVSVNGDPISSPTDFARIYRQQGLPVQLTILRNGREIHRH